MTAVGIVRNSEGSSMEQYTIEGRVARMAGWDGQLWWGNPGLLHNAFR